MEIPKKKILILEEKFCAQLGVSPEDMQTKGDHKINKKKYELYYLLSQHVTKTEIGKRYNIHNSVVCRGINKHLKLYQ